MMHHYHHRHFYKPWVPHYYYRRHHTFTWWVLFGWLYMCFAMLWLCYVCTVVPVIWLVQGIREMNAHEREWKAGRGIPTPTYRTATTVTVHLRPCSNCHNASSGSRCSYCGAPR